MACCKKVKDNFILSITPAEEKVDSLKAKTDEVERRTATNCQTLHAAPHGAYSSA